MAWTLNLSPLFDRGMYYSTAIPPLIGSIFTPPNTGGGGTPIDTVTSASPPSFLSLPFPSAASPPAGVGTVLVTDSVTSGDLVRSGPLAQFPPSPASAPLVTAPPALITPAKLDAAAAAFVIPPTAVPDEYRVASGLLSAGGFIPLFVTAGPPTVTLGNGTITLDVPASVAARYWYFSVRNYTATLTLTYTPAPSHDPAVASRILSIPLTSHKLVGLPWPPLGLGLGAFLAVLISPMLETKVNETIASEARDLMAQVGLRPTPTAVFSARNVTILPSGINLQLALADLFGPGFVQGSLLVAVAPTPAAAVQRVYTVTVTNSATNAAIPGATVTLHNYTAAGTSTVTTATTNAAGQATFTVTLRSVTTTTRTVDIDDEGVLREVEGEKHVTNPTLTVSSPGFASVTRTLL